MSRDTLSNLLRAIRLRGAMFYQVEGSAPWVAEAPRATEIIPAILPGVEHLMEFHVLVRGGCWAGIVGEPGVSLEAGDLVIFPQGDAHVVSSAPGLRAERVDLGLYHAPRPPQLPYVLRMSESADRSSSRTTPEPDATLFCGFIGCDVRPFNPLLSALPRVLKVPAPVSDERSWLAGVLHAVVAESSHRQPGGEAVLERMAEMLFVEAVRRYVGSMAAGETGWLAGLNDAAVGRALSLLHERPGETWTLERLSEAAAVSRSTLHERFSHFLGMAPMQYLAQWRMQIASQWLRESDAKVLEIALEVGYESEAAFARAFRRATGESPAAWRRTRRPRSARRRSSDAPASPPR